MFLSFSLLKEKLKMVNFDAPMAKVYEGMTLTVDRIKVNGRCRFSDAGTSFTCYFSDPNLLFYFACYAQVKN